MVDFPCVCGGGEGEGGGGWKEKSYPNRIFQLCGQVCLPNRIFQLCGQVCLIKNSCWKSSIFFFFFFCILYLIVLNMELHGYVNVCPKLFETAKQTRV